MRTATQFTLMLALCLAVTPGCKDRTSTTQAPPVTTVSRSSLDTEICGLVADMLGLKDGEVSPDKTLADLAADELDVVEIIMEIEDKYGISITDEAIGREAGGAKATDVAKSLKVSSLVKLVTEARKAGPKGTRPGH
jgi:acyl carrier protein